MSHMTNTGRENRFVTSDILMSSSIPDRTRRKNEVRKERK
jgi:hypothetical protein